jgi:hypothetical protein
MYVYLLERRVYTLTKLPDWLEYADDYFEIKKYKRLELSYLYNKQGQIDENLLYNYLCNYEGDEDCAYCIMNYQTVSVWTSEKEVYEYAHAREYNYPYGWRIRSYKLQGNLDN